MSIVIAVDGPAASGKGTLARRLATALRFAYLDTGVLYRAVGQMVLDAGEDPADPGPSETAARSLTPGRLQRLTENPTLREDRAAGAASRVAAIPGVRTALLALQRQFAAEPPGQAAGAVLDGRDIGTVVCPDAAAKLFVDAAVEVRAQRRFLELQQRGVPVIYTDVLRDLMERDQRDRCRPVAPLIPAEDAFVLDTSRLAPEQVLATALAFLRSRSVGPT